MKKHPRILICTLALIMFLFAGCGSLAPKSYQTLEEWYDANPFMKSMFELSVSAGSEDSDITFHVEDNTIIYRLVLDEVQFGESEEDDQLYTNIYDQIYENDRSTFTDLIADMADLSGIAESSVSLRIEVYNPDSTTPDYTKTFTPTL
jgi:hypothetical protein